MIGLNGRRQSAHHQYSERKEEITGPPGDLGNIKVGREIIKRLLDDGTLTPPGTAMDKDSYV